MEAALEAEAVGVSAASLAGASCWAPVGGGGAPRFRSPLRVARTGKLAEVLETAEWWWKCRQG